MVSSNRIDLTWADNSSNEESFRIERSNDGVSFSPLATVAAGVTNYSNTGLNSGVTYYYRVYAANVAGNSTYSNIANGTTPASAPSAPTNLSASAQVSGKGRNKSYAGSIDLSWSDTSSNEAGFTVERCDSVTVSGKRRNQTVSCNGTWSVKATLTANATTYADTTALASRTYLYRVKAGNLVGSSGYSNEAAVSTPAQ